MTPIPLQPDAAAREREGVSIRPIFAWYDLWVGAFWDRRSRCLYVLPLPCIGFVIRFRREMLSEVFRGVTYYPNEKTGAGAVSNAIITIDARKPATAFVNKVLAPASLACGQTQGNGEMK